jgi:hypothetical protein
VRQTVDHFFLTLFITRRQKWSKENVQWLHDGEAVQYEPTKYYYFRRDLSIGSESDTFTLPNVPMIVSIKNQRN